MFLYFYFTLYFITKQIMLCSGIYPVLSERRETTIISYVPVKLPVIILDIQITTTTKLWDLISDICLRSQSFDQHLFFFFFLTCHIFRVSFEMNWKQTCPLDDDGRPTCRTSMCGVVISHQRDINLIRWSTSFKKWAWQQRVRVMADLEERLRKIKEGETQGYLQRWAEREREIPREIVC